jgi:hypothetical protein
MELDGTDSHGFWLAQHGDFIVNKEIWVLESQSLQ